MTDKQIVDVSKCEYYKEYSDPNEDGDEYNNVCECSITESAFCFDECNSNCYFKNWQRKEQECEELKNIINEAKNSKLDLKSFLVGEAVQNEYEEQLGQLKGVIKKYEECNKYLVEENGKTYTRLEYKLLKTLTEIKYIAMGIMDDDLEESSAYYDAKQILQKINEVEDEKNL